MESTPAVTPAKCDSHVIPEYVDAPAPPAENHTATIPELFAARNGWMAKAQKVERPMPVGSENERRYGELLDKAAGIDRRMANLPSYDLRDFDMKLAVAREYEPDDKIIVGILDDAARLFGDDGDADQESTLPHLHRKFLARKNAHEEADERANACFDGRSTETVCFNGVTCMSTQLLDTMKPAEDDEPALTEWRQARDDLTRFEAERAAWDEAHPLVRDQHAKLEEEADAASDRHHETELAIAATPSRDFGDLRIKIAMMLPDIPADVQEWGPNFLDEMALSVVQDAHRLLGAAQ